MNQRLRRSIALLLLIVYCVVNNNYTYAQVPEPVGRASMHAPLPIVSAQSDSFQLPISVPLQDGYVSSMYQDTSSKGMVFLLEDAHGHSAAQLRESQLIAHVARTYHIKNIFLEGAADTVSTALFSAYPESKGKEKVFRDLLRDGAITGVEYFSIMNTHALSMKGLEDAALYQQHLACAKTIRERQQEWDSILRELEQKYALLKNRLFSRALFKLDCIIETFHNDIVSGSDQHVYDYLAALMTYVVTYHLDLTSYPSLRTAYDALLAEQKKPMTVNSIQLMQDTERFAHSLRAMLAVTPEEKTLLALWKDLALLLRALHFNITREEVQAMEESFRAISETAHESFIHQYGLGDQKVAESIRTARRYASQYYVYAKKRDRALGDSLLRELRATSYAPSLVVTGGFHTAELEKRLRDAQIAYVSIRPRIDAPDNEASERYQKNLMSRDCTSTLQLASFFENPAHSLLRRESIDQFVQDVMMRLYTADGLSEWGSFEATYRRALEQYLQNTMRILPEDTQYTMIVEQFTSAMRQAGEAIRAENTMPFSMKRSSVPLTHVYDTGEVFNIIQRVAEKAGLSERVPVSLKYSKRMNGDSYLKITRPEKKVAPQVELIPTFVEEYEQLLARALSYTLTFPDGVVREASVARGVLYRMARAAFHWKSGGYLVRDGDSIRVVDDMMAAHEIEGRYSIFDDACYLWFLVSFGDRSGTLQGDSEKLLTELDTIFFMISGQETYKTLPPEEVFRVMPVASQFPSVCYDRSRYEMIKQIVRRINDDYYGGKAQTKPLYAAQDKQLIAYYDTMLAQRDVNHEKIGDSIDFDFRGVYFNGHNFVTGEVTGSNAHALCELCNEAWHLVKLYGNQGALHVKPLNLIVQELPSYDACTETYEKSWISIIGLDRAFVKTLLQYKDRYPNAVQWILAQRLIHESAHEKKPLLLNQKEASELFIRREHADHIIPQVDIPFLEASFSMPGLREEIDTFLNEPGVHLKSSSYLRPLWERVRSARREIQQSPVEESAVPVASVSREEGAGPSIPGCGKPNIINLVGRPDSIVAIEQIIDFLSENLPEALNLGILYAKHCKPLHGIFPPEVEALWNEKVALLPALVEQALKQLGMGSASSDANQVDVPRSQRQPMGDHASNLGKRSTALLEECGIKTKEDISAASFRALLDKIDTLPRRVSLTQPRDRARSVDDYARESYTFVLEHVTDEVIRALPLSYIFSIFSYDLVAYEKLLRHTIQVNRKAFDEKAGEALIHFAFKTDAPVSDRFRIVYRLIKEYKLTTLFSSHSLSFLAQNVTLSGSDDQDRSFELLQLVSIVSLMKELNLGAYFTADGIDACIQQFQTIPDRDDVRTEWYAIKHSLEYFFKGNPEEFFKTKMVFPYLYLEAKKTKFRTGALELLTHITREVYSNQDPEGTPDEDDSILFRGALPRATPAQPMGDDPLFIRTETAVATILKQCGMAGSRPYDGIRFNALLDMCREYKQYVGSSDNDKGDVYLTLRNILFQGIVRKDLISQEVITTKNVVTLMHLLGYYEGDMIPLLEPLIKNNPNAFQSEVGDAIVRLFIDTPRESLFFAPHQSLVDHEEVAHVLAGVFDVSSIEEIMNTQIMKRSTEREFTYRVLRLRRLTEIFTMLGRTDCITQTFVESTVQPCFNYALTENGSINDALLSFIETALDVNPSSVGNAPSVSKYLHTLAKSGNSNEKKRAIQILTELLTYHQRVQQGETLDTGEGDDWYSRTDKLGGIEVDYSLPQIAAASPYARPMGDDNSAQQKGTVNISNYIGGLDSKITPMDVKSILDNTILQKDTSTGKSQRHDPVVLEFALLHVKMMKKRYKPLNDMTDDDREWNRRVAELQASYFLMKRIKDDDDCILAYHFTELMSNYVAKDDAEMLVEFWRRMDENDLEGSFSRWLEWVEMAKKSTLDITAFGETMKWLFERYYLEDNPFKKGLTFLLEKEQKFRTLCDNSAEKLSRMIRILFYCDDVEGEKVFHRFPEIEALFLTQDKGSVMLAVAHLATAAGKQINSVLDEMLDIQGHFWPLINGDLHMFEKMGILAGNCGGEKVLERLETFLSLMRAQYHFAQGSEDERRLVERLADASNILRQETFDFLNDFLADYPALQNGTLESLLHMITFSVPMFRLVQFHEDYESLVVQGKLGKINNECYYVSLRDLVQSTYMLTRRLDKGMDFKEALKRAVVRRYYNRCSSQEDQTIVKKLMIKHHLVSRKEGLATYFYDIEGLDSVGDNVMVWEREREGVDEREQHTRKEFLRLTRPIDYKPAPQRGVLSEHVRKNVAMLLDALESDTERVNPVLLYGTTAGGKSTLVDLAGEALGTRVTRIQINENTDEFDLFGSFQPHEVTLSLKEAYERIHAAVNGKELNAIIDVLGRLQNGENASFVAHLSPEEEAHYATLATERERQEYMRERTNQYAMKKMEEWLSTARALLLDGACDEKSAPAQKIKAIAYMLDHEIGLHYVTGQFVEAYKRGGIILLDEVNLANEEMLGILYQTLTMGYLKVGEKTIYPAAFHKPRIVATANPSSYAGRKRMSEAFMNRFEIINIDPMTSTEMAEIIKIELEEQGYQLSDLALRYDAHEVTSDDTPGSHKTFNLIHVADVQQMLNRGLLSGVFPEMGSDSDYVFTLRNLKRIVNDVCDRKRAGETITYETWIKEAYFEFANILKRDTVFNYDVESHVFRVVMQACALCLGIAPEDFERIVKRSFSSLTLQETNEIITIDGIALKKLPSVDDAPPVVDRLVDVESTKVFELAILKAVRHNQPLLFTGQSGGGKTEMIGDMAARLNWPYVSVSLGDATLESLIGTMEYNRQEGRFVYRPGVLIKAMDEGSMLVLEELNMAKSGIVELLNEYFDKGYLTNPYTQKLVIPHKNFRLMATLNPTQGVSAANGGRVRLSPALRNRFREVWVPHEKSETEMREIIGTVFQRECAKYLSTYHTLALSPATIGKICQLYREFKDMFEKREGEGYYTSLREPTRIAKMIARYMIEVGMSEEYALERAVRRIYYERLKTDKDRSDLKEMLTVLGITETAGFMRGDVTFEEEGDVVSVYEQVQGKAILTGTLDRSHSTMRSTLEDRIESTLIETARTKSMMQTLVEGARDKVLPHGKRSFNPILFMGETAAGKSSIARYVAEHLFQQKFDRIQFNERTDEMDLFGCYEPVELVIAYDEAYRIVLNALEYGDWRRIRKGLQIIKKGSYEDDGALTIERIHEALAEDNQHAMLTVQSIISASLKGEVEAKRHLITMAHLLKNGIARTELRFREGRLLRAMHEGSFVMLDEINLASEESIGIIYQLLTYGYIEYYNRDTARIDRIYPAEGFALIATANPAGYAGRNKFSEAFINRFELHYIDDMTPQEMADIVAEEIRRDSANSVSGFNQTLSDDALKSLQPYFVKLAELQKLLNEKLGQHYFDFIDSSQNSGYVFTLRNLKKIVRDMAQVLQAGNPSPPVDILLREAYHEYVSILVRSPRNQQNLDKLFTECVGPLPFEKELLFASTTDAIAINGLTIRKKTGDQASYDAAMIEPIVEVPSTNRIRYQVMKGILDPKRAVMLIGQSGGGKTEIIGDLARELGWKYRSVSLGNATLDTLIGCYVMDDKTKRFVYQPGILVKAMREGAFLVLEEINMAESGLIEILNEYFDEGTFTNPISGMRETIDSDFRLFATMNPEKGVQSESGGRVGLSPALRSRFSEVWVPHEKTEEEVKTIIRGKFAHRGITNCSDDVVDAMYKAYATYYDLFEERTIGSSNNEGYYTSLRDIGKMIDIIARDIEYTGKETVADINSYFTHAFIRMYTHRMHTEEECAIVTKETGIDAALQGETVTWENTDGVWTAVLFGKVVGTVSDTELDGFVMTEESRIKIGRILDALTVSEHKPGASFNPLMLYGETSGGKSTYAEIAARIMQKRFTRIQMNQRTDEYDLFGSFHPLEEKMTFKKVYDIVSEAVKQNRVHDIQRAVQALHITDEEIHSSLAQRGVSYTPQTLYQNYLMRVMIPRVNEELKNIVSGASQNQYEFTRAKKLATILAGGLGGLELSFMEGQFLEAFNRGDMVLLDEINLANEEALAVLYQVLTLGYIELNGEKVFPGKGFQLIVTGNPSTYYGRNRMSEAFMNRFEIEVIPPITRSEALAILKQKYGTEDIFSDETIVKLYDLQKELDIQSKDRAFDLFNMDGSYVFSLRNLERIVEDALKRYQYAHGTGLADDMLIKEAYLEYVGLLSQSERNIKVVQTLFDKTFEMSFDFKHFLPEYRIHDTGDTLVLNGVAVSKREQTETDANRVKKLVDFRSMANVRTQIMKGFRNGDVTDTRHVTRPVLLVGQSGGGKTEMIADICRDLQWKYTSVSLGAATIESLVGSYILDETTGTFSFQKGILIDAMEKGHCLVLEEINMAESSVIEILNQYFDRGTFTIPDTGDDVVIDPNFRLFATMNPRDGITGQNRGRVGLSPALRSRFREVWVDHYRTPSEKYRICLSIAKTYADRISDQELGYSSERYFDYVEFRGLKMVEGVWQRMGALMHKPVLPSTAHAVGSPVSSAQHIRASKPELPETKKEKKGAFGLTDEGKKKWRPRIKRANWDSLTLEDRKREYETTFKLVAGGQFELQAGKHWSWNPEQKILTYAEDELMNASLEELVGTGVHEAMHRYGTRYLALFKEYFEDDGSLPAKIFNIVEDARIENWARRLFGGVGEMLERMNVEGVFGPAMMRMYGEYRDDVAFVEGLFNTRISGNAAKKERKPNYYLLLEDFLLYMGKRGFMPGNEEASALFLTKAYALNTDFGDDLYRLLIGAPTFEKLKRNEGLPDPRSLFENRALLSGGMLGTGMPDDSMRPGNRGVFSILPIRKNAQGNVVFWSDVNEETITELAREHGEKIRENIMPIVFKWAVQSAREMNSGADGKEGKGGTRKPGESGSAESGTPGTGKPAPGKPGKGAQGGRNADKDMWDALSDKDKQAVTSGDGASGGGKVPGDRTRGDAKDYQAAVNEAQFMGATSTRTKVLQEIGASVRELMGYLNEIVVNAVRPKFMFVKRGGVLDTRRLMKWIGSGFSPGIKFYKKKFTPTKKNMSWTLILDESGSMTGATGYNAMKGAVMFAETLASLGMDFQIMGFGSGTHLHKRFKGQIEHSTVPDTYDTLLDKERVVTSMYNYIGEMGGTDDALALTRALEDVKKYGSAEHVIIILTDAMGDTQAVQEIIEKLEANHTMVGSSHTQIVAMGIGSGTEHVKDVYGPRSIHIPNGEERSIPKRFKELMTDLIKGIYTGEKNAEYDRVQFDRMQSADDYSPYDTGSGNIGNVFIEPAERKRMEQDLLATSDNDYHTLTFTCYPGSYTEKISSAEEKQVSLQYRRVKNGEFSQTVIEEVALYAKKVYERLVPGSASFDMGAYIKKKFYDVQHIYVVKESTNPELLLLSFIAGDIMILPEELFDSGNEQVLKGFLLHEVLESLGGDHDEICMQQRIHVSDWDAAMTKYIYTKKYGEKIATLFENGLFKQWLKDGLIRNPDDLSIDMLWEFMSGEISPGSFFLDYYCEMLKTLIEVCPALYASQEMIELLENGSFYSIPVQTAYDLLASVVLQSAYLLTPDLLKKVLGSSDYTVLFAPQYWPAFARLYSYEPEFFSARQWVMDRFEALITKELVQSIDKGKIQSIMNSLRAIQTIQNVSQDTPNVARLFLSLKFCEVIVSEDPVRVGSDKVLMKGLQWCAAHGTLQTKRVALRIMTTLFGSVVDTNGIEAGDAGIDFERTGLAGRAGVMPVGMGESLVHVPEEIPFYFERLIREEVYDHRGTKVGDSALQGFQTLIDNSKSHPDLYITTPIFSLVVQCISEGKIYPDVTRVKDAFKAIFTFSFRDCFLEPLLDIYDTLDRLAVLNFEVLEQVARMPVWCMWQKEIESCVYIVKTIRAKGLLEYSERELALAILYVSNSALSGLFQAVCGKRGNAIITNNTISILAHQLEARRFPQFKYEVKRTLLSMARTFGEQAGALCAQHSDFVKAVTLYTYNQSPLLIASAEEIIALLMKHPGYSSASSSHTQFEPHTAIQLLEQDYDDMNRCILRFAREHHSTMLYEITVPMMQQALQDIPCSMDELVDCLEILTRLYPQTFLTDAMFQAIIDFEQKASGLISGFLTHAYDAVFRELFVRFISVSPERYLTEWLLHSFTRRYDSFMLLMRSQNWAPLEKLFLTALDNDLITEERFAHVLELANYDVVNGIHDGNIDSVFSQWTYESLMQTALLPLDDSLGKKESRMASVALRFIEVVAAHDPKSIGENTEMMKGLQRIAVQAHDPLYKKKAIHILTQLLRTQMPLHDVSDTVGDLDFERTGLAGSASAMSAGMGGAKPHSLAPWKEKNAIIKDWIETNQARTFEDITEALMKSFIHNEMNRNKDMYFELYSLFQILFKERPDLFITEPFLSMVDESHRANYEKLPLDLVADLYNIVIAYDASHLTRLIFEYFWFADKLSLLFKANYWSYIEPIVKSYCAELNSAEGVVVEFAHNVMTYDVIMRIQKGEIRSAFEHWSYDSLLAHMGKALITDNNLGDRFYVILALRFIEILAAHDPVEIGNNTEIMNALQDVAKRGSRAVYKTMAMGVLTAITKSQLPLNESDDAGIDFERTGLAGSNSVVSAGMGRPTPHVLAPWASQSAIIRYWVAKKDDIEFEDITMELVLEGFKETRNSPFDAYKLLRILITHRPDLFANKTYVDLILQQEDLVMGWQSEQVVDLLNTIIDYDSTQLTEEVFVYYLYEGELLSLVKKENWTQIERLCNRYSDTYDRTFEECIQHLADCADYDLVMKIQKEQITSRLNNWNYAMLTQSMRLCLLGSEKTMDEYIGGILSLRFVEVLAAHDPVEIGSNHEIMHALQEVAKHGSRPIYKTMAMSILTAITKSQLPHHESGDADFDFGRAGLAGSTSVVPAGMRDTKLHSLVPWREKNAIIKDWIDTNQATTFEDINEELMIPLINDAVNDRGDIFNQMYSLFYILFKERPDLFIKKPYLTILSDVYETNRKKWPLEWLVNLYEIVLTYDSSYLTKDVLDWYRFTMNLPLLCETMYWPYIEPILESHCDDLFREEQMVLDCVQNVLTYEAVRLIQKGDIPSVFRNWSYESLLTNMREALLITVLDPYNMEFNVILALRFIEILAAHDPVEIGNNTKIMNALQDVAKRGSRTVYKTMAMGILTVITNSQLALNESDDAGIDFERAGLASSARVVPAGMEEGAHDTATEKDAARAKLLHNEIYQRLVWDGIVKNPEDITDIILADILSKPYSDVSSLYTFVSRMIDYDIEICANSSIAEWLLTAAVSSVSVRVLETISLIHRLAAVNSEVLDRRVIGELVEMGCYKGFVNKQHWHELTKFIIQDKNRKRMSLDQVLQSVAESIDYELAMELHAKKAGETDELFAGWSYESLAQLLSARETDVVNEYPKRYLALSLLFAMTKHDPVEVGGNRAVMNALQEVAKHGLRPVYKKIAMSIITTITKAQVPLNESEDAGIDFERTGLAGRTGVAPAGMGNEVVQNDSADNKEKARAKLVQNPIYKEFRLTRLYQNPEKIGFKEVEYILTHPGVDENDIPGFLAALFDYDIKQFATKDVLELIMHVWKTCEVNIHKELLALIRRLIEAESHAFDVNVASTLYSAGYLEVFVDKKYWNVLTQFIMKSLYFSLEYNELILRVHEMIDYELAMDLRNKKAGEGDELFAGWTYQSLEATLVEKDDTRGQSVIKKYFALSLLNAVSKRDPDAIVQAGDLCQTLLLVAQRSKQRAHQQLALGIVTNCTRAVTSSEEGLDAFDEYAAMRPGIVPEKNSYGLDLKHALARKVQDRGTYIIIYKESVDARFVKCLSSVIVPQDEVVIYCAHPERIAPEEMHALDALSVRVVDQKITRSFSEAVRSLSALHMNEIRVVGPYKQLETVYDSFDNPHARPLFFVIDEGEYKGELEAIMLPFAFKKKEDLKGSALVICNDANTMGIAAYYCIAPAVAGSKEIISALGRVLDAAIHEVEVRKQMHVAA